MESYSPAWTQVRHIPAPDSVCWWAPHKDLMEGTEVYGEKNDHSSAWSITFNDIEFSHFKVESANK